MIKPKTLIVLGAASSADIGFPLGNNLKKLISDRLHFRLNEFHRPKFACAESEKVYRSLSRDTESGLSEETIFHVCKMICQGVGLASSIDNFLEMRKTERGIAICAKTAIASIILEQEQKCRALMPSHFRNSQQNSFDGQWRQNFSEICFEDATADDLPEALSRFSVISFNYDRSFEQFIRTAIMLLYSLEWPKAVELSKSLVVTHPYGSLGPLPGSGNRTELEFGDETHRDVATIAKQIRTFTEQFTEEVTMATMLQQVREAQTIIFLGFGYHEQNIRLLDPSHSNVVKNIYGTAIDIADAAKASLSGELELVFGRRSQSGDTIQRANVKLEPEKDCRSLLKEYAIEFQDRKKKREVASCPRPATFLQA